MPKARLSNNRGLVQSSGDGLQLTPSHENGAGMHFKSVRFEFLNTTGSNVNNKIIAEFIVNKTMSQLIKKKYSWMNE